MAKRAISAGLVLLAFSFGMAVSKNELPSSFECEDPVVETIARDGVAVRVSRQRCVDKMGPDANGLYEFHYEYDLYEFSRGLEILHARSYTTEPEEAHFLAIERDNQREFLCESDFGKPLVRSAVGYLRAASKTSLYWLDPRNEEKGYSAVL